MDEMRENMRRVNPVDDLVHRTDSPFVPSVNSHPLPSKFKMPSLTHMMERATHVIISLPSKLRCIFKEFQTRLCVGLSLLHSKGRRECGSVKIPLNSVSSFDELSKLFVNNFIGGQRHKRSSSSLLTIE